MAAAAPANRLSSTERARVLAVLDSARFVDQPPMTSKTVATLLGSRQRQRLRVITRLEAGGFKTSLGSQLI